MQNLVAKCVLKGKFEVDVRTEILIGMPRKNGDIWTCEEQVLGFPLRSAQGYSSLEALSGAMALARIDIEVIDGLGHVFDMPGDKKMENNDEIIKQLFGLYSSKYALILRDNQ